MKAANGRGPAAPIALHEDPDHNRLYTKTGQEMYLSALEMDQACKSGDMQPVTLGVDEIDAVVNRMIPKSLTYIVGLPSHGKSLLLRHMARRELERIEAERAATPENAADKKGAWGQYVLFTSLEDPELDVWNSLTGAPYPLSTLYLGAYDSQRHREWALSSAGRPVVMQGYESPAITRELAETGDVPGFTVEQARREIVHHEREFGLKPSAWFIDYLQLWESESGLDNQDQERLRIASASLTLKRVAKLIGVPVICAAQAKATVHERRYPIPTAGDIEGSNQPQKDADVILSVCLPERYGAGRMADLAVQSEGQTLGDAPAGTMVVSLCKQRMGQGYGRWAVSADLPGKHIRPYVADGIYRG